MGLLAAGMIGGWFFERQVFNFLEDVVREGIPANIPYEPIIRTLPGAFMLKMKMAFYIGLFATIPFTVYQLWGFIAPGLRPVERKPVKIVAPISVLLFFIGAGLCWMILPMTVTWFASFMADFPDAKLMLDAGSMVFLLVKMMLAFGVGFQMPLVVFFLAKLEIITPDAMMKYWRHAVVGVIIAAAIITPGGNPFVLAMMSLPLIALFFISVAAARWTIRKRKDDDELNDLD